MNTSKFVYKGVELDLDVDNLEVDDRIQAAVEMFQAELGKLADKDNPTPYTAKRYVQLVHGTVNAIFDREDAADLLFKGETRLSGYTEGFARIATIVGKMRGLAVRNASGITEAAAAAMRNA